MGHYITTSWRQDCSRSPYSLVIPMVVVCVFFSSYASPFMSITVPVEVVLAMIPVGFSFSSSS